VLTALLTGASTLAQQPQALIQTSRQPSFQEEQMKRTIAIAGSLAALTFAAAPITAFAAANTNHRPVTESKVDHSRDVSGVSHVDRSLDKSKDPADKASDLRDK
jgi:hypothetical protein